MIKSIVVGSFLGIVEILQQRRHNVLYYISVNSAYTGTTLTSMYREDMWFHHILKWKIFIVDKSSTLTFLNYVNDVLEPLFFLLYEVPQNDPFF